MSEKQQTLVAHGALVLVTLVWGTTFSLVKLALRDATPLAFNLARMGLAFAVLVAINSPALRGLSRDDVRMGALAGVFLAAGYQLQTAGLAYTTAAKSAFLTGLVVVMVPLLATVPGVAARGHRRPGAMAFVGAGVAFAGLIFLTTPPGSGAAVLAGMHRGEWLSLGCAVAYAAHLLTLARAAPRMPARRLGTLQIGFCALAMVVTLPLGGRPTMHWSWLLAVALGVTAVLATAVAFTVQSWAQQKLPATHTALIFTMEPVFAWVFSVVFLHERMGARSMVGAGLILVGILAAELGPLVRERGGVLPTAEV